MNASRRPIEIWMAASEIGPLAQAGGMGDVLRALPPALAATGLRVRRFLPAYGAVDRSGFTDEGINLAAPLGPGRVPVRFLSRTDPGGVVTTLVVNDELFGRDGIYGPPGGKEFRDSARRFALFCRAVCERARHAGEPPAVLHLHDWHTGPVPLLVRHAFDWPGAAPRTVLTIHNMGYQGTFAAEDLDWLSLPEPVRAMAFHAGGLEDHGGINFLKAGIAWADRLTVVSPTYAREILSPPGSCGLDGLLQRRQADLAGILNGADYDVWNPAADPHLPLPYDRDRLEGKQAARLALREALGLPAGDRPVLGVVGRLVPQKGIDVLLEAAPDLLESGAGLAVLGSGDADLTRGLEDLRARHPARVGLWIGFDERLSHLVVAGSDILLMPSRYEPCGLTQMHALRYGTIPVVNRTGGLADTVRDEASAPGRGTGFAFEGLTAGNLTAAVRRALRARAGDAGAWRDLMRRAMAEDFSWARAAARYADLYDSLIG